MCPISPSGRWCARRCASTASGAPIDVHLMVSPVDRIVAGLRARRRHLYQFPSRSQRARRPHHRADPRARLPAGLVFNPATRCDWLDYTLEKLDLVLLMSVNPGFGGQKFIPSALAKIAEVRRRVDAPSGRDVRVEVDGGIKVENIGLIAARPVRTPSSRARRYSAARTTPRPSGRMRVGASAPRARTCLFVVVLVVDRRSSTRARRGRSSGLAAWPAR